MAQDVPGDNPSGSVKDYRESNCEGWSDAVENAAAAIAYLDLEGRCIRANRRFLRVMRCSTEELSGRRLTEFMHPEDAAADTFKFSLLASSRIDSYSSERCYIRKDGTEIWVQESRNIQRDKRGNALYSMSVLHDITERHQIEEQLRLVAQFPEENPNPVMRVSDKGEFLYLNPAALQRLSDLGWGGGQSLPEGFRSLVERALQSSGVSEHEIQCAEGRIFLFTITHLKNAGYVNLYGRDITAQKRAEEILRRNEDRYRGIVEVSAAAAWTARSDGWIIEDSPSWRRFTGQTVEQFLGKGWVQALHPEDRERAAAEWKAAVERRATYQTEYRLWHAPRGAYHHTLARGVPLFDEDGSIREWVGMNIDITGRIRAENALRHSEERLRATFDNAGVGIVEVGADDRFIAVNKVACQILARTREQLLRMNVHELTWPADRPTSDRLNREVHIGLRDRVDYEKRYIRGDGLPVWVHVTVSAIRDSAGQWIRSITTIEDITERKRAEEQLAAAKAEAEHANRAKDHFLAVLSHELRTPLTPVVMGLSMLKDKLGFEPQIGETLEMIRQNVDMEARLIDDLLDVTRIARGKVELNRTRVELDRIISRAVEVCMPDIEARRLKFGVDMGLGAPHWVDADPSRLQQVFWNLLKNAIKFTPHGGCVGIRCYPSDKHIYVEVNDSGIGVEPEALSRIFDAFEQAERSITRKFGGLGLGLAISKALVEMHGGSIEAQSDGPDRGTTFRIRLPMSEPADQSVILSPPATERHSVPPLRILLVEDHGVTANMIRILLKEKGHTVETAGDIATALELADRHKFDLLLSDLGLPDGSGHDLMRELRLRGHNFPGIALSGYGQEEDVRRSHEAGFGAHLTKPASREAIDMAVAAVAFATPDNPLRFGPHPYIQ